MRLVALMGVAALLSACAMGPDYSRPDIPVTDSFRMAEEEKNLQSLADMPWWELYRDATLQKLIRISLEENKDLEHAVATVEEFEARLFISRTDYAPQMTATANGPTVRQGGVRFPGFANPFNYYLQGNLAWEIDVWGRIRRSNEAARADLLAREDNRRAIVLQLVGGVAQSYFDLRQFDLQLEIAERTLKAWNESVRISQARHRQGLIDQLDVEQSQVNALQAALRLASLRYKGSLANYLDVLIAQRNLFDAELSLASTRRLYLTSVVQLYKALGGGWSPDGQGVARSMAAAVGAPSN